MENSVEIELKNWIEDHKLNVQWLSPNVFDIDGKFFIFITDYDKEQIIDSDFDIIVSHEELLNIENTTDYYIEYLVFRLGNRFYYSNMNSLKIIPFRNFGLSSEDNSSISYLGVRGKYDIGLGSKDYNEWCKKALFLGIKELGLCEENTLAGTMSFQEACINNKIKPILGERIRIFDEALKREFYLKVYVKNIKGWKNILNINTYINVHNMGFIRLNEFLKHSNDIIVVIDKETFLTEDIFNELSNVIDKESLFQQIDLAEYNNQGYDKDVIDYFLNYYHNFFGRLKPVFICDSFYLEKEDFHVKKAMSQILGKKSKESNNQHFKFLSEICKQTEEFFENKDKYSEFVEICVSNTKKISEQCNFKINTKNLYLPKYKFNKEEEGKYKDSFDLLLTIIDDNFEEKVLKRVNPNKVDIYIERLKKELKVIKTGNVVDYFLILWDIVRWCKEKDILTGIGRGSAAGSLITYLLDITRVDPIEYDLLFERFLSQARLGVEDVFCNTFESRVFEDTECVTVTLDDGSDFILMPGDIISIVRNGKNIKINTIELIEGDIILN